MKRRVPVTVLASLLLSASFLFVSTTPAAAVTFGANGRVVFASDRSGSMQVYSMRYGGDGVIQLTTDGTNFDPSYSGDGQKIAFISSRNGSNQLFTMAADGSAQTLVPVTPGTTPSHPSWAPNGSAIAFAGLKGTDSDIYSIKPGGTGLVDFTPDLANFDNDPSWSPGGMTIAFDRTYATGGTDVWSVQQTGTGLKQLTRTGYDSHPSWSPDNKNLVFQSTRDSVTGPVFFASVTQPVGMAWTAAKLLVTQQKSDKVLAVDSFGNTPTTFATLPSTGKADIERYIAVSPGLGGFPAGDVYVSVRQDIYQITPDGITVTPFANCGPSLPNSNNFLTFDQVGTFGYKLIEVAGQRATVWTIDSAGVCTQIADLSSVTQELEGSEVAPTSFIPFGGDLIAASKFDNTVYEIDPGPGPNNTFSVVGTWDSPEQALFVPAAVCNWSNSGGAFFVNVEGSSKIVKFPANSFSGLAGSLLVTSEDATGIGQFTSNGVSIDISTFYGPPSPPLGLPDLEEAVFAGGCAGHAASSPSTGSILPNEIYKMTSAGANQTRLTTNNTDDSRPAWSPDGTSIVYQSDRDDPNQPGCEGTGTCIYEIYTMSATDGSGQVNVSNDVAFNDTSPDWETVSFPPITTDDFFYSPQIARPKLGGAVLWEFYSDHTASDNSGMGLFDSGTKNAGEFFEFTFTAAGQYPIICHIHPTQMSGNVKVPMKVAPVTGNLTTVFTITWANAPPPLPGWVFDVQISRPGGTGFVDWNPGVTKKMATFTADSGTGTYLFQARLRNPTGPSTCVGGQGACSNYSAPISITVTP